MQHSYGWLPDKKDKRDLIYRPQINLNSVPQAVNLRSDMPTIYDQGQLGSCTANAIAAALDYQRVRQAEHLIYPSRLFIYYNERKSTKTTKTDSGATIRESVKAVKGYGACPETEWPYVISKFTDKPVKQAYTEALSYEDLLYQKVNQTQGDMQSCLAEGQPFVIGINVYESFESTEVANNGQVPMPAKGEKLLGGHALLVVGYEANGDWIFRNSWGESWGDRGYGYFPQEYLLDSKLSSDFWTLTKVK